MKFRMILKNALFTHIFKKMTYTNFTQRSRDSWSRAICAMRGFAVRHIIVA